MADVLTDLKTIFSEKQISTTAEDLAHYGKDWSVYFEPRAQCVVFPENNEQVEDLLKWATKTKTSLVPSGGRTGLSGGATATNNEVVVSFDRMNKILDFNPVDRTIRVQAGVVTEAVQQYAKEKDYYFPIDFAAKGSSQIGGNVATNAGGVKVVRYGLFRDWVAGLVVYTGRGERLELNRSLVKNATGYDLRNLFIGSEGTLGLITEVELKLTVPPKNVRVLLLGLENRNNILDIFCYFRDNSDLSACEYFSGAALDKVMNLHGKAQPLSEHFTDYLLIEVENTNDERLLPLFESVFEKGWVLDGSISQSTAQAQELWGYRELISESLSPETPYKNDVSVKVSKIPEFIEQVDEFMNSEYPDFQVIWFGHIGDGNLHLNILKPEKMDKQGFVDRCRQSDKKLFSIIQKLGGAISAEHGVGLIKKKYLSMSRSESEIEAMRGVKKIFDPAQILNPGKIF